MIKNIIIISLIISNVWTVLCFTTLKPPSYLKKCMDKLQTNSSFVWIDLNNDNYYRITKIRRNIK